MNLATIRKAKNGDQKSINEIIKLYSPAIKYVGKKFFLNFHDVDDLEQLARIGIWKSILKFQEDRLNKEHDDVQVNKLFSVCVRHYVNREVNNIVQRQERSKRTGLEIEFHERHGSVVDYQDTMNTAIDLQRMVPNRLKKALGCILKTKNVSEAARLYDQGDTKFRTTLKHLSYNILKTDFITY